MNRYLKLTALAASILSLAACSKVPAGYRGVIVNMYGTDKGVSEQSVGVGRYYLGFSKEMYEFPTFLQNHTWSSSDQIIMQTSDGLTISSDVGITYSIEPDNVVKVFQKYRTGIDEITNVFLRNMVRDAMNTVASTMSVEDLYGSNKSQFMDRVNVMVKEEATEQGIFVDKIYLVGTLNLPETVTESINSKIQATQNAMKVENEIATANAEAQKTIIQASAQAKANLILSQSLTPEFIQYQTLQKWNGVLPQVTSNAVPIISIGSKNVE